MKVSDKEDVENIFVLSELDIGNKAIVSIGLNCNCADCNCCDGDCYDQ